MSTEKSVATKYEESGDPTLLHQPHDGANEMLKSKILQNISMKSDHPRAMLDRFLVNQALWVYSWIRVCG